MGETIRVEFKKRNDGKTTVTIAQGARSHTLVAWAQGIIPHEMVHAAVEKTWPVRGFIRLVAGGADPNELAKPAALEPETLLSENLTNAFQYELAGWAASDDDVFRDQVTSYGSPLALVEGATSREEIAQCRELLLELSAAWTATPVGEKLVVELEGALPAARR